MNFYKEIEVKCFDFKFIVNMLNHCLIFTKVVWEISRVICPGIVILNSSFCLNSGEFLVRLPFYPANLFIFSGGP
jgi:hypothetical protein